MPVFKASHYGEHFSIVDFIISFDFIKGFGDEDTGIPLFVILQDTEDASRGETQRVRFNSERFGRVGIMEDKFRGKTLLEVVECKFFVFASLPLLILSC